MQETMAIADNRATADRRHFTWRTVAYGYVRSRRRGARRVAEGDAVYTDWHHPWLFFLAVGTMMMSSLDAFMTLELIARGAVEINPVMATLMGHGTATFAAVKMGMTAAGILALVFLARARFMDRFRAGVFLTLVFSMYACLVCYEFVHLMHLS